MKNPYVVYWWNDNQQKWQSCSTLNKAIRFKTNLNQQKITKVWLAKDI